MAESTGKAGRGLLPVLEAAPGDPAAHGADRMTFVLRGEHDDSLAALPGRLPGGEPVFEAVLSEPYDVGGEFVRWEWAVALFCALVGIECFDQPDVAEAKAATRSILSGEREASEPRLRQGGVEVSLSLPEGSAADIVGVCDAVAALLDGAEPPAYLAVLAYLPEDERVLGPLRDACAVIAETRRLAVTLELGPRYLHSTGQYHKGGPATGRFLMVTSREAEDLAIPGERFTLGRLDRAQAEGDFSSLADHGRPIVHVSLPACDPSAVAALAADVAAASRR